MNRFKGPLYATAAALVCVGACLALPPGYKGKPYKDPSHKAGPAVIPGTVQCALYDLGGEGVAYHDTTATNDGAKLNHSTLQVKGVASIQCRPGVSPDVCFFREGEGVDISYTKDFADFNHPNLVDPPAQQLYIGWEEDGEWTNYTVKVKTAGTYKIVALYGNDANTIKFDVDGQHASVCNFPSPPAVCTYGTRLRLARSPFRRRGCTYLRCATTRATTWHPSNSCR